MSLRRDSVAAITVIVAVASSAPARADCEALRSNFDVAIASRSAPAIIAANRNVEDSSVCDVDIQAYTHRAIDGVIDALGSATDKPAPQDVVKWLFGKLGLSGDWRSAEKVGRYFDARGDRRNAQVAYEMAVGLSARNPASPPTLGDLKTLNNEAFAAKSLAGYDAQGLSPKPYPNSVRSANGDITVYSVAIRTVGIGKMPVPVNFVYDSTEMTEGGKAAAKELADVVMQQKLERFRLIGHADPRGGAAYNLKLSVNRAQALKKALQEIITSSDNKYLIDHRMPEIIADGKGATDPFDVSYLPYKPSVEEVYQLDRRVEFELLDQ